MSIFFIRRLPKVSSTAQQLITATTGCKVTPRLRD